MLSFRPALVSGWLRPNGPGDEPAKIVRAGKEGATMALLTALEERHKASGDIIGKNVEGLKQNQHSVRE